MNRSISAQPILRSFKHSIVPVKARWREGQLTLFNIITKKETSTDKLETLGWQ